MAQAGMAAAARRTRRPKAVFEILPHRGARDQVLVDGLMSLSLAERLKAIVDEHNAGPKLRAIVGGKAGELDGAQKETGA
jgi:hypothetical protein